MRNVKLMTLNLHCLVESDIEEKQGRIANYIQKNDIDIICFQEVAQTADKSVVFDTVKEDNYILVLQQLLEAKGITYYLYYKPFKESFGIYDEGLGFLSKYPLTLHQQKQISQTSSYHDWHRRYVVTYKLRLEDRTLYLANTHFGWSDETEVFEHQYDQARDTIPTGELGFLVGDYNITPDSKEYAHIMTTDMIDLFDTRIFQKEPTHFGKDRVIRIDYMMSTKPIHIIDQAVVFTTNTVSDHAALSLEIQLK